MSQDDNNSKNSDIRATAKKALAQLLEPLAGFTLDSGLSIREAHAIFRAAAIMSVASRQLETSNRINISGIAATTGVSRADVSRVLKVAKGKEKKELGTPQQSTNRILAAWHEDPRFTGSNGQPADLKLYGRGVSFEALARRYGRGIPTRAVLDELVRTDSIELLGNQKVRAKASMAVERGMSVSVIKAFGDRAAELLSTMLINMRRPETPNFIATVSDSSILTNSLPRFRKELSIKGADFLAEVQEDLNRMPQRAAKRDQSSVPRVSVTVFYHETISEENISEATTSKRRNFRRKT